MIDRLAYARALVLHRCGDVLSDEDIDALMQPDDTLPVEVADKIVEVIDLMEAKLESLVEALRQPPPAKTVISACRQAMVDLDVDAKVAVVDQLHGWVEAERGTYEPLQ